MSRDAGPDGADGAGTPVSPRAPGTTQEPAFAASRPAAAATTQEPAFAASRPAAAATQPAAAAMSAPPRTRTWVVAAVARGFALFFGGFTLVSVAGSLRHAQADFTIWWVAVPAIGRQGGGALLALLAAALLGYAVAPRMRSWRRWSTVGLVLAFAAITAWNGVDFYRAWREGIVEPGVPVPLSFVVCAVLVFVAWAALRPAAPPRRRLLATAVLVATASACVLAFPVAQVFFFGTSDYRRDADAVVVFGAQVHSDGHLSTSLKDRMATAVDLYRDDLVDYLIVSGGVGDSGLNEALVMRDVAIEEGVPAERVVVDSSGVNTDATVHNTMPFFGAEGWTRILAVSQYYHLPRIKLAYQRAGWDVLTVPAGTSSPIPQTPTFVAREIPAFWLYYLRAVVR